MDRFVTCLCKEDYKALIISGTATDRELNEAWVVLLSEYHELKGDDFSGTPQGKITTELIRLQHHLMLLQKAIDFLKDHYSESIADSVRKMGYSFRPASKKPADYQELLYKIVNKAKTKFVQIEQLTKQLQEAFAGNEKPTTAEFEQRLNDFEEMQHVRYNLEDITVTRFIALEKKYKAYIDQLEAKLAKHGN